MLGLQCVRGGAGGMKMISWVRRLRELPVEMNLLLRRADGSAVQRSHLSFYQPGC